MRNLRPIGVPYSIVFENLFSKAYDSTKLDMDMDMLRNFYQERGYFTARAVDFKVVIRDVGGGKFRVPLFYMNRPGKRADVTVQVEEGRQYVLNKVNFAGMKLFKTQDFLTRRSSRWGPATCSPPTKLRKGIEEMQKLYGTLRLHRHGRGAEPRAYPQHEQAGSHVQYRRRQAVLRAPHRLLRQHDHARQGHPPRVADRRRRHVQLRTCGTSASCA